ncbi:SNF2 family domain-containing protein [Apiospora arundinis]
MATETFAVLGSTGNSGTALIETLLQEPDAKIHAYCRNRSKLFKALPGIEQDSRVRVFEGSIQDVELVRSCIRDCQGVFLVVSTNDNIPGCRVAQDTAQTVIKALEGTKATKTRPLPKLALLSSATIDDHFSRHLPRLLRMMLLRSASNVYADLIATEALLRAEAAWLTTVYVKPGALSIDVARGHALSLTDEDGPLSYRDLAAAMVEAVRDPAGAYDHRNVSVVNTHGPAKFPTGTPWCIFMGLIRHFFPFLNPYLPANTGPR